MVNKGLLGGIIGFILGGLIVSSAFVLTENKDDNDSRASTISTVDHNKNAADQLKPLKGDAFDKAFMAEMINHHQGAIDMAELTQTNAKHDEVKQLGKDILITQSKEIDMMQSWQSDWGYKSVPRSHDAPSME